MKCQFWLVILLCPLISFAQVDVPVFGKIKFYKGYERSISGENISYFSALQDVAKTALLTRCQTGTQFIGWETEPIPENASGKYVYFTWLAAHSKNTSGGDRKFDLYINDEKIITITTLEKKNVPFWTFSGNEGEKVVFEWKTDDGAGDAHGFMFLRVPLAKYKKGEPLRLKLTGQNQNSPDWFMTFKYQPAEYVDIFPVSFLTKDNKQPLQVVVVHFGKNASLKIKPENGRGSEFILKNGQNNFEIMMDAVSEPAEIKLDINVRDLLHEQKVIALKPCQKREIYFIHHSHYDVGYSHLQEEVIAIHNRNIADALRYIDQTKEYPEGSKYKWNIETTLAIENFLKVCTPDQKEKLIKAIKNGDIGIGGLYANIMTGICQPEELFNLNMYARRLEKEWGICIPAAMIGDIPGMTWSTIPALVRSGIKYFSDGPNYTGSFPYHGDRVGHSNNNWSDRPFWWVSPSGNEKILFWMAGKGYSSWHGFKAGDISTYRGKKKISEYMNELDETAYPYQMVQWRYNIVADNGPTDSLISNFVRDWNLKYESPRIVLSTVDQMFREFEKRYGNSLPAFKGDLTPYWEDGAYSTAAEMNMNRINSEKLITLSAAQTIIHPNTFPDDQFDQAWKNVLLWDEHTWGAHNSISEPDAPFVVHQWKYKQHYALRADSIIRNIEAGLVRNKISSNVFDVVNPTSWVRTDIVYLDSKSAGNYNYVNDEHGTMVQCQKLSDGRLAILAENVPALAVKRLTLSVMEGILNPSSVKKSTSIENRTISLFINELTGSISSIIYKPKKTELVSASLHSGMNEYLYVPGRDPLKAVTNGKPEIGIKESGPLFTTISIKSDAPGCNTLNREVTLLNALSRIEIVNTIDKKALHGKESVHFAFPYAVKDAATRFNTGWGGIFQPGVNQLAGSNQDYYSIQHWCDVSDQSVGFSLLVREACLVEPGAMINEQPGNFGVKTWKTKADSQHVIYSYVMNNYWHTNYKADQEGMVTFCYAIVPHALFNQAATEKDGIGFNRPMILIPAKPESKVAEALFEITNPNILATTIIPDKKSTYIRFFNSGGAPEQFRIKWKAILPSKVRLIRNFSDSEEIQADKLINLPASGIVEMEVWM